MFHKSFSQFLFKEFQPEENSDCCFERTFAQTCCLLEIFISDDGSTDGSWEYIQTAVESFRLEHVDVSVILSYNEKNLGNLVNWQKYCGSVNGEMPIKFDGDNISHLESTAKVMDV